MLGSAVAMLLTIGLSIVSYRRGYDLDAVSTPIVTASGDMVTIPCVVPGHLPGPDRVARRGRGDRCVVVCLYATVRGFITRLPQARRAIVEMTGVILLTPPLDILAGTVVQPRISRFALFPALLAIIPPLVSNAGALGGILSSRLSSKLHLGVLSPRALPESPAILDAGLTLAFGLVAFTAVGVAGYLYGVIIGKSLGAGIMIGGTLLAGMIATAAAIVVAYYVAILTARFGLDPDNHSVPIITSVMDLAGVLAFLLVVSVLGAGTHA